jgi:DNA-binding SARP family transcriptional activator/nucleoid-associated protein YgaU
VTGRLPARGTAALVLLVLGVGVPVMLAAGIGWPLPASLPSWEQATLVLTSPPSGRLVLNTVAVLCWVLWAAFISQVAADLAWMARHGLRRPDRHTPLRGFTFALLAALLSGSFGTAAAAVAPLPGQLVDAAPVATAAAVPGPVTASTTGGAPARQAEPVDNQMRRRALWEDPPGILPDPAATGTVLVQAGTDRHTVEVAAGDTLWDLAQAWLGEAARWPEIEALNRDRYPMDGGAHIEPDWVLVLPDDAAPPATGPADQSATGDDGEGGDGEPGLVHEVAEGDWMWHIADRYLGDPQRYPQIAAHNPTYAQQYPGWPDHIEPGDELVLPPDAHDSGPRRHATGEVAQADEPPAPRPPPAPEPQPPAPSPSPPDGATGSPTPRPSPPSPVTPADPDGVVPDPAPTSTPGPTATTSEPAGSPTPPADPSPGAGAGSDPAGDDSGGNQPADDGGDGVVLGDGSWIPWAVAAAVAAAMAVVWLQRRRRYRPRRLDQIDADTAELYLEEDPDPAAGFEEPAAVSRIRRALRTRLRGGAPHPAGVPEPGPEPDPATGSGPDPWLGAARPAPLAGVGHGEQPAPLPVPAVEPPPEGGIGIVGPGAEAAARGALVAALSAGAPVDPDAQTEVILPAETMVTLLGADAVTLGTWRRLRVAPDLDAALAVVEARLLTTARLLDEYDLENLAALRAAAPAERPVPPLLLIAATPEVGVRMRTRNALGLGTGLGVSALLLGSWDHGPTIHIEADGTCRAATGGDLPPGIPPRMAVVDQQAASELLATLREAHTGQVAPPAAADPAPPPATAAGTPTSAAHGDASVPDEKRTPFGRDDAPPPVPEPAPTPPGGGEQAGQEQEPPVRVPTARVRVLGVPEIEGWQKAGRPLRKAAVELLTYLACHRDGAAPEQIQEDLWPDSRRRLAATKLHTAASNLRHLLAADAADHEQAGAYVRKEKGRYRIPAGPVEIDLWTLQSECARARAATDPAVRVAALRRACQAYRGELAAGRDYEWVTVHREAARALALDAHTTLAGLVADEDPQQAARLLLRAVEVDPMAEAVYRQAMRACHRTGDAETIRSLLRQLTGQLEAVGGEPADETTELAQKLRAELNQRPGRAGTT